MVAKKASKGQASITSNGGHLRISLPRNLFDGKQKHISLGLNDTPNNRAKAQMKLAVVQKDIAYEQFDYTLAKYSSNPTKALAKQEPTIRELIDSFKEKYFFSRVEERPELKTFGNYFYYIKRFFSDYCDLPLSEEIITKVIGSTKAGSASRKVLVSALSVFCNEFKFEYNFTGLKKGYKSKDRNLPEDESIECAYKLIQKSKFKDADSLERAESWGWIIMILATYGLRTHEVLAINYEKSFKPPYYVLEIDGTITNGTKTGDRKVYPIPKIWVEKYELYNVKNKVLLEYKRPLEDFSITLGSRIRNKREDFKEDEDLAQCLKFQAYDLRHRYAIRGHELEYSVEAMARWMGHSVTMHVEKYHKYLKDDTDRKVFEAALQRIQESERRNNDLPSYEELEAQLKLAQEKIRLLEEQNIILKQSSS